MADPTHAPFAAETMLGDGYEIMLVRCGLPEQVSCVWLGVGTEPGDADGSLTLTPDEARTLADWLRLWAGLAEAGTGGEKRDERDPDRG